MKYTLGRNLILEYVTDSAATLETVTGGKRIYGTSLDTALTLRSGKRLPNLGGEPIIFSILVINNHSTDTLKIGTNGHGDITVQPGETKQVTYTASYYPQAYIVMVLAPNESGGSVDATFSNEYIGFGSLPDTIPVAPELSTTAGSSLAADSIAV